MALFSFPVKQGTLLTTNEILRLRFASAQNDNRIFSIFWGNAVLSSNSGRIA